MLTISKEQFDRFSEVSIHAFVKKCVVLLQSEYPDWCNGKSFEQLRDFTEETLQLAQEHAVYIESNIQSLLRSRVEHNLSINLPAKLLARLSPHSINEGYRVDRFIKFLTSNDRKLISLDDDIEVLRREYV